MKKRIIIMLALMFAFSFGLTIGRQTSSDKATELIAKASERAGVFKNKAADIAGDVTDRASQTADTIKNRASEIMKDVADKTSDIVKDK